MEGGFVQQTGGKGVNALKHLFKLPMFKQIIRQFIDYFAASCS